MATAFPPGAFLRYRNYDMRLSSHLPSKDAESLFCIHQTFFRPMRTNESLLHTQPFYELALYFGLLRISKRSKDSTCLFAVPSKNMFVRLRDLALMFVSLITLASALASTSH